MNPNFTSFNQALFDWYEANKRDFPWRHTQDPYQIWISEIMSQQTQITRVADGFYPKFLERFPDVFALAKAEWEDVFPLWDGLGYYSRGKNLLKTAKILVKHYEGKFPETPEGLEKLPGIGKYTASAICSFALHQEIPAIDTNISKIIQILWSEFNIIETAHTLVKDASDSWIWNSAMMDLADSLRRGITIEGDLHEFFPPEILPKFKPKRKKLQKNTDSKLVPNTDLKRIEVGIACIHKDGKYLIQSRPKGKSFAGWWEFPGGKREKGESYRECVKREIQEEIGVNVSVRPHFLQCVHQFENVELILTFHRCQIQAGEPAPLEKQKIKWVLPSDFGKIKFLKTNAEAVRKLKSMRV